MQTDFGHKYGKDFRKRAAHHTQLGPNFFKGTPRTTGSGYSRFTIDERAITSHFLCYITVDYFVADKFMNNLYFVVAVSW